MASNSLFGDETVKNTTMNKIGDLNNYHDLNGLQQLKAHAKNEPESQEALKKAAQHFESIFIGMMLKSMRDANKAFEEGNPMHSNTTNFFRDMYDQQLATDMSDNGSMGLADIIVQQLSGDTESFKAASVLRNDATLANLTQRNSAPSSDEQSNLQIKENTLTSRSMENLTTSTPDLSSNTQIRNNVDVTNKPTATSSPLNPGVNDKFESPEDFVSKLWDVAKQTAKKIGLNPAVMLAQSALETGWGKHVIQTAKGDSSFNLFNVKAHRDWTGDKVAQSTLEFEQGVAVRKTEPFRAYNNFAESFDDFVSFLNSSSRYEEALNKTQNPEQFLQSLQKAGYATDPNYADKIIGILKSDRFKEMINNVTGSPNSEGPSEITLGNED